MKYDFTTILDRSGQDCKAADLIPVRGAAVDPGFTKIPMWIADMSFPVFPLITDAIRTRLDAPHFGYFDPPPAYYDAIRFWQKTRNGVSEIPNECIGYENGVLGCVSSAVTAFTAPGESVLVHSPTYIGFTHVLKSSGRNIVTSRLVPDENQIWRMNYEEMDQLMTKHRIHTVIFCSPHNPTGRIWEREEIEKAMEIFAAHNAAVISDEIWSDFIMPGYHHIPTQSVSEDAKARTVAIYAPSKTFNLAGLVGSYHIIYDPLLRDRVRHCTNLAHYNLPNVLSVHALIGAYQEEGCTWVDELCQVIDQNISYAFDFIRKNFDGISLIRPQGTYLLYLDCSKWCRRTGKTTDDLLKAGIRVGVIWQDGRPFLMDDSIRMNLALPHSLVVEALDRLKKYVFSD